nr:unnamed protein product [Callosobruchus analis]
MTSMSPETAKDVKDMIEKKSGRYLEALIQWSCKDNGRFILLAAGDETLFKAIQSCTKAFSSRTIFLGEAGYACSVYLVLQLIKGVCLVGLSESIHLAERLGVHLDQLQSLFSDSQVCNSYLKDKMEKIVKQNFEIPEQRLENLQTDMKLGLDLSNGSGSVNQVREPMSICALAHEVLKHCCKLEYGGLDPAAIYFRNKH